MLSPHDGSIISFRRQALSRPHHNTLDSSTSAHHWAPKNKPPSPAKGSRSCRGAKATAKATADVPAAKIMGNTVLQKIHTHEVSWVLMASTCRESIDNQLRVYSSGNGEYWLAVSKAITQTDTEQ